ncbi:MAG: hypothetical protein KKB31_05880 [Nanoarchaeota archaeon]|nr:hypothetical protein [Nanoarchaeota archaeon]
MSKRIILRNVVKRRKGYLYYVTKEGHIGEAELQKGKKTKDENRKEEQKKPIKKKWVCSVCGKNYGTYPVILDDNILSIASELELREEYYKGNKGLCKECREKL